MINDKRYACDIDRTVALGNVRDVREREEPSCYE
jgi:hypothetical protein